MSPCAPGTAGPRSTRRLGHLSARCALCNDFRIMHPMPAARVHLWVALSFCSLFGCGDSSHPAAPRSEIDAGHGDAGRLDAGYTGPTAQRGAPADAGDSSATQCEARPAPVDECATSADCKDGAPCIVSRGAKACAPHVPFKNRDSHEDGQCIANDECGAGAWCVTIRDMEEGSLNRCRMDECDSDDDCKVEGGFAFAICVPAGPAYADTSRRSDALQVNACSVGQCRVDADCGDCGHCNPLWPRPNRAPRFGCVYPDSPCKTPADCAGTCIPSPSGDGTVCGPWEQLWD
jgi:hypothetical protein